MSEPGEFPEIDRMEARARTANKVIIVVVLISVVVGWIWLLETVTR